MVATHGANWRLAPSLVVLFAEADHLYPNRSKASDGSLGDPAHASRVSDHNPDASGDVLAGDLTDDKANGCDADALAHHLIAKRDGRIKYIIWNRTIVKSYGDQAWVPHPYTGTNPHDKHTHISVLDTTSAKGDTSPWFPAPQEDDMTPAEVTAIVAEEEAKTRQWIREELKRVKAELLAAIAAD